MIIYASQLSHDVLFFLDTTLVSIGVWIKLGVYVATVFKERRCCASVRHWFRRSASSSLRRPLRRSTCRLVSRNPFYKFMESKEIKETFLYSSRVVEMVGHSPFFDLGNPTEWRMGYQQDAFATSLQHWHDDNVFGFRPTLSGFIFHFPMGAASPQCIVVPCSMECRKNKIPPESIIGSKMWNRTCLRLSTPVIIFFMPSFITTALCLKRARFRPPNGYTSRNNVGLPARHTTFLFIRGISVPRILQIR